MVDLAVVLGCIFLLLLDVCVHWWMVFERCGEVGFLFFIFGKIVVVIGLVPIDVELSGALFFRYNTQTPPSALFPLVKILLFW